MWFIWCGLIFQQCSWLVYGSWRWLHPVVMDFLFEWRPSHVGNTCFITIWCSGSYPTSDKAPPPNTTIAEQVEHIYQEIKVRLQDAVNTINLPEDMLQEAQASGGFKLYVSGGGFRGLGNMLLSRGSSIEKLSVTPAVSSTRGTSTPNATTNDELNATLRASQN